MASLSQTPPDLPLCRGDRVRMSPLGRERHPRYGTREGVIVGQGSPSSWRVKFDDRKTIQAIHQDYLERVPGQAPRFDSSEIWNGWRNDPPATA
ncbi:hypothetical protein Rpal_2173 [Rhodopseudomonas palustris TIE-1]|uniref:hypothetical protein n=1 Tax=Rhodopseudomonas palustris TaxID=1076 RepID=UPI000164A648|nr:hypothetical protein [Rhodopseudomonas palustris]ACF00694.1 hypothetical protein Rpal_2173 [Rhodopseudomonas palustris TIE-1]